MVTCFQGQRERVSPPCMSHIRPLANSPPAPVSRRTSGPQAACTGDHRQGTVSGPDAIRPHRPIRAGTLPQFNGMQWHSPANGRTADQRSHRSALGVMDLVLFIPILQDISEIVGRAHGVGMVFAEDSAHAGEGFFGELTGLFMLP